MVRSIRRSPLRGLALVGLGFLLASMLAGSALGVVGSAIGLALFLPFLLLKVAFMIFVFGALLRFVGGGWGGRHYPRTRRSRSHRHEEPQWRYRGRPMTPTPPAPGRDESEWEEHLRQARREVDDLDAPYTEPSTDVDGR